MKFGKKKQDPSAEDTKPGKRNKKAKGQDGPGSQKRLGSVAVTQALVVLLAGAAVVALLQFLVLQPSAMSALEQARVQQVESARQQLNQYLSEQQKRVQAVANQPFIAEGLGNRADSDELARHLETALPNAQAVFVFPENDIPRTAGNDGLLGFAGLELARRAQNGQALLPDAFPRDNRWYLQFAARVEQPGGALAGTVLAVFEASTLRPFLVAQAGSTGKLELIQTVAGTSRTVVAAGSGNGATETRTLLNPDWSVSYRTAAGPEPVANLIMVALVVAVPVLVAAILVWLLLSSAQRGIRQDVAALIQWAHKVFGGERVKMPTLKWDMVASTGEVLHRLSQVVDKRVAKASESARPRPVAGKAKASAPQEEEEPLFQDKEVPDIDMLDGDEDVLGFGGSGEALFDEDIPEVAETEAPDVEVSPEIFRAYDIRGIVGQTLSPEVVETVGRAIGSEAVQRGVASLCIGYDGRHSSPELSEALARGVMAAGCDVVHIGAVPTPVLYFATHHLATGSGVMVTGSHNPANYNGLKIMLGGETLSGEAIQKLYQRIQTGDFSQGQGSASREDVRRAYLDRIVGDIAVAAPLRVVVDAGNGIAGELGPMLIEELGCEVTPLYCEVDGDFPHHHPDPGKPANLQDLIAKVQETGADIGLAFDGDGDRLGVVTNSGKIIWPDRLLMLFARDVVSRNPGADVIYDVKCSRRLAGVVSEAGGRPIMWKTGHSLMKAKMKETGALLAGEMSGHVFFSERWYGFDDGLYTAARLLEILGIEDRDSDDVFADFPEDISTPELNVDVTESEKFAIIDRLAQQGDFGEGNISTIDGIRVDYTDGWGLCRASNTTPVLVLRFEAESEAALEHIKAVFREQLQKAAPDLIVDF